MKWDAQLLRYVYVCKARRVCNDSICNEWSIASVARKIVVWVENCALGVRPRCWAEAIASLDTRAPAADKHGGYAFASLADLATLDGIESRHQTWVLHHERHEFGGVTSNTEELQPILLDKVLESRVSSDANPMAVCVLQDLAQSNERLDIAAGADNLNDNIQLGRRLLPGLTTETWRNISWRQGWLTLELPLNGRPQDIS